MPPKEILLFTLQTEPSQSIPPKHRKMEDILERKHFSFSLDVVYMTQVFASLRHFFLETLIGSYF